MTRRERERVSRHAAVVAAAAALAPAEPMDAPQGRWEAVRRWRGEAPADAPPSPDPSGLVT
jgi:hypothetical protein